MKIIFNDGTTMSAQAVEETGGQLQILTLERDPVQLRALFSDPVKTKIMKVTEREETLGQYEGYTEFYRTEEYTGGIYGVVMNRVGKSTEERLSKAEKAVEKTNTDFKMAVAELSMMIAAMMGGGENGVS